MMKMRYIMKILRIEYKNLKLFKKKLVFDFTATDRIVDIKQVYKFSSNINFQKVIAIAGINATGKSLSLRLINFASKLLMDNTVLKDEKMEFTLFQDQTEIIIDFVIAENIYRLRSVLGIKEITGEEIKIGYKLYFKNEVLYSKPIKSVKLKKGLFEWSSLQVFTDRNLLEKNMLELLNDNHSIIIKITKNIPLNIIALIDNTNVNFLIDGIKYNNTFTNLFDDSIEKIEYESEDNINLNFKDEKKSFNINNLNDQYRLLSSGTIKGTLLLNTISLILKRGGYLIIDEIEVHLNKTLVEVIINLFMDEKINKYGAVLIFTTHYVEILDIITRKDAIYVSIRDENHKIQIEKFSDRIKRNDIKKSEVLLSNYFGDTAPKYRAIQNVRKLLCNETN